MIKTCLCGCQDFETSNKNRIWFSRNCRVKIYRRNHKEHGAEYQREYYKREGVLARFNERRKIQRLEEKKKLVRFCKCCGGPIPPERRTDADFCDRDCKGAWFHNNKQPREKPLKRHQLNHHMFDIVKDEKVPIKIDERTTIYCKPEEVEKVKEKYAILADPFRSL